jgi:ketosteroid isomerase-like protein
METDDADLVRRFFEAVNRRDFDAAFALVSADVVVDWTNSRGPDSAIYAGRERAREFMGTFFEAWALFEWILDELIELPQGRLLATHHMNLRGLGSGVDVRVDGATAWTVRDGEVTAVKAFQSGADALAEQGHED